MLVGRSPNVAIRLEEVLMSGDSNPFGAGAS
jgi:hypothetical protein